MEYINTSSSKAFYDFLKSLNALFFSGKEMNILWFQDGDDPDPYIDGEDLHYFVKIPFDIIELTQDQIKELEAFISQL